MGRRIALGRRYDAQDAEAYPFAAILEFHSREDLVAYLDHPAHRALGEQFYTASESALALDFEMLALTRNSVAETRAQRLLRWSKSFQGARGSGSEFQFEVPGGSVPERTMDLNLTGT